MNDELQKIETNIVASPRNNNAMTMAGANALVQRTLGEVQVAVMMAKQFPRDKIYSKEKLLNDCCREGLASVATYSYSKGGTEITGPSIRLAEAAKNAWGNMQSGWRELARTTVNGVGISEVEAFAWDTENNTRASVAFTVRHWRDTKSGGYPLKEEREIYELCANQASRRERACILKMIDGDMIEEALKQVNVTLTTKVQVTPERIKSLVKTFFDEFEITEAQIEKRVQRRVETINPATMISLTKIYNSLKDGMSKKEDWFEPEEAKDDEGKKPKGNEGVKDAIKKKAPKTAGGNPETGGHPKEESTPASVGGEAPANDAAGSDAKATHAAKDMATKPIPLHSVAGNAAATDFERWKLDFMKGCNSAQSKEHLLEFYSANVKVLGQIKTRAPIFYDQCEQTYEDNLARFDNGE